ncbi:MAG TPA: NUDIX domain-containing protein [Pyrinomonadaceae bacterium]|nr:NUDIX domain-containing protein [Pyrinomonadaceae bacterium]
MPEGLPRVGSALLVRDEANRILLGKRNKDPQRGSWIIPGGKIRPFESIGGAGARELREETGLDVEVQGQFRVYEIINPPDEHRIVIYSWGKVVGGIAKASDDISELAFFSSDQLSDLQTSPLVRRVLADAGLVARVAQLSPGIEQLNFVFLPILLPSSKKNASGKLRRSQETRRTRRPRTPRRDNAPLLF